MDKKKMLESIIAHETNGNKAQFAKVLGVSAQTISAWLARNTFDAENIYAKCRYINPSWLLTGEGPMLKNLSSASDHDADERHREEKNVELAAHRASMAEEGIPLIPFSAMAGMLSGEQKALEYECERYVIPAFTGADFLMQVSGNSMAPTYVSGDIVACQRVPMAGLFFQWNKPYVIDTNQGAIIKRIKPGSDTQHVLIVSDNKDYDPFELPYQDIYAVALVIGIIRIE